MWLLIYSFRLSSELNPLNRRAKNISSTRKENGKLRFLQFIGLLIGSRNLLQYRQFFILIVFDLEHCGSAVGIFHEF